MRNNDPNDHPDFCKLFDLRLELVYRSPSVYEVESPSGRGERESVLGKRVDNCLLGVREDIYEGSSTR